MMRGGGGGSYVVKGVLCCVVIERVNMYGEWVILGWVIMYGWRGGLCMMRGSLCRGVIMLQSRSFFSAGSRRQKVVVHSDSSALLNQLRREEQERQRESRKKQQIVKRAAYDQYLSEMPSWEERLFEGGFEQQMKAMWEVCVSTFSRHFRTFLARVAYILSLSTFFVHF